MNSQSPTTDRKLDDAESEMTTEEQKTGLLATTTTNDESEKQEHLVDHRPAGAVTLAVEYHAVDDGYTGSERRRCSRSRADDVITVDSVDRLLPQSPSPRSVSSVNAQRRAEFFGLKPPSRDRPEQVTKSHLGDAASSFTAASTGSGQLPERAASSSSAIFRGLRTLLRRLITEIG